MEIFILFISFTFLSAGILITFHFISYCYENRRPTTFFYVYDFLKLIFVHINCHELYLLFSSSISSIIDGFYAILDFYIVLICLSSYDIGLSNYILPSQFRFLQYI